MKCQILFSGKNKKNISKCRLLKILPRVLSVSVDHQYSAPKGSEFFRYSKPFSEGKQKIFDKVASLENVSIP